MDRNHIREAGVSGDTLTHLMLGILWWTTSSIPSATRGRNVYLFTLVFYILLLYFMSNIYYTISVMGSWAELYQPYCSPWTNLIYWVSFWLDLYWIRSSSVNYGKEEKFVRSKLQAWKACFKMCWSGAKDTPLRTRLLFQNFERAGCTVITFQGPDPYRYMC